MMMAEILMWILFVLVVLLIVVTTIQSILESRNRRDELKLEKHKSFGFLLKIEIALRDFILAYDDQEPEQLLGAYQEAENALELIEEAKAP